MRADLLEFLFGNEVVQQSSQQLGEHVVKLFEDAADKETEEMVATKEPLNTALKSVGIDKAVDAKAQSCELTCDDAQQYRDYCNILFTPETMHKLASKGWVPARNGDVAMTFEPAEFKIGFIEIATAETNDKDKAPDLEKVLKDAQKFAATEIDHDDLNPVEFDKKGSKDGQNGVGEPKDGAAPEGKPKGSSKKTESVDEMKRVDLTQSKSGIKGFRFTKEYLKQQGGPIKGIPAKAKRKSAKQVAESLLEMTGTGAIPAMDGPPPMSASPNWKERLKSLRKRRGEKTDDDDAE